MKKVLDKIKSVNFLTWVKILILILILILLGLFLVNKITLPSALDLPRQIQNGKDVMHGNFRVLTENVYSYTEPYQPFANHHWLFGVFSYILYISIGWMGITIFKVLMMLSTFVLLFWLAVKRSNFWSVAVFSIPTIFILLGRTAFRPEIFSYLFLVLYLILLFDLEKNPKSKNIFWFLPIQLIWVNTHIFFPIGILLVCGFLFEKLLIYYKEWKTNILIKRLGYLLLGLILITFLNPYGLKGVAYSLIVNTSSTFPIHSMEITTALEALINGPGWSNISIMVFLPIALILFIGFIVVFFIRLKKKKSLFENNFVFLFLASVGSAGLSYYIFRALPLFGYIFLLSISIISNDIILLSRNWIRSQTRIIQKILKYIFIFSLICIIIFCINLGQRKLMQYQEQGFGIAKQSLSSSLFFKEQDLKGPIFNDTDSGSYLIGTLYPKERVFSDNRFGDAYSAAFFRDVYLPFIQDEDKWKEGMKRFNFNIIFMSQYNQGDGTKDFIYRRIYDPDWVWVYADKYNVILVRNVLKNKDVIDKYMITYQNAPEKLKFLINSDDPADKMNAADLMNLIGRTDISIPLYLQYVSLKPESGEIWFVLGRTELLKTDQANSNPSLAAIYLENALNCGWIKWDTYSYLALAYLRTGQFERMKEAVNKEVKIMPNGDDTQRWVKIVAEEELKLKNAK